MRAGGQHQLLRLVGLFGDLPEILLVEDLCMHQHGDGEFQRGMQRQTHQCLSGRKTRPRPAQGLSQQRIMVATGQEPDKNIIENSQLILIRLQREIMVETGQTLEQASAFRRIAGSQHGVDIAQKVSCL